jgi:hypothetical protein
MRNRAKKLLPVKSRKPRAVEYDEEGPELVDQTMKERPAFKTDDD